MSAPLGFARRRLQVLGSARVQRLRAAGLVHLAPSRTLPICPYAGASADTAQLWLLRERNDSHTTAACVSPPPAHRPRLQPPTIADFVGLRVLCTYAGAGTLYVPEAAVSHGRLADGSPAVLRVDEAQAAQAAPFDLLFLKGHAFEGVRGETDG